MMIMQEYESLTVIIKVAMRAARGRTESIDTKPNEKYFHAALSQSFFRNISDD